LFTHLRVSAIFLGTLGALETGQVDLGSFSFGADRLQFIPQPRQLNTLFSYLLVGSSCVSFCQLASALLPGQFATKLFNLLLCGLRGLFSCADCFVTPLNLLPAQASCASGHRQFLGTRRGRRGFASQYVYLRLGLVNAQSLLRRLQIILRLLQFLRRILTSAGKTREVHCLPCAQQGNWNIAIIGSCYLRNPSIGEVVA
jgi:hypothetical protein